MYDPVYRSCCHLDEHTFYFCFYLVAIPCVFCHLVPKLCKMCYAIVNGAGISRIACLRIYHKKLIVSQGPVSLHIIVSQQFGCLKRIMIFVKQPSSSIQLSATGRTWITRICAMSSEPPTSLLLPGQFTVDSGGPNNPT